MNKESLENEQVQIWCLVMFWREDRPHARQMLMQCVANEVFFHVRCSVKEKDCSVNTSTHSHGTIRYPSVFCIMFYDFNLPTYKLAKILLSTILKIQF